MAAADIIVELPPQVMVVNDSAGMQIVGVDGQTIELLADDTVVSITPALIELEAPDISLTSEGAVEVETSDMNITAAALEAESGDISLSSGAVEVEAGLFTVL